MSVLLDLPHELVAEVLIEWNENSFLNLVMLEKATRENIYFRLKLLRHFSFIKSIPCNNDTIAASSYKSNLNELQQTSFNDSYGFFNKAYNLNEKSFIMNGRNSHEALHLNCMRSITSLYIFQYEDRMFNVSHTVMEELKSITVRSASVQICRSLLACRYLSHLEISINSEDADKAELASMCTAIVRQNPYLMTVKMSANIEVIDAIHKSCKPIHNIKVVNWIGPPARLSEISRLFKTNILVCEFAECLTIEDDCMEPYGFVKWNEDEISEFVKGCNHISKWFLEVRFIRAKHMYKRNTCNDEDYARISTFITKKVIQECTNLKHLRLNWMPVPTSDLMDIIDSLPPTLEVFNVRHGYITLKGIIKALNVCKNLTTGLFTVLKFPFLTSPDMIQLKLVLENYSTKLRFSLECSNSVKAGYDSDAKRYSCSNGKCDW